MKNISAEEKKQKELKIVLLMIQMYCKKKHKNKNSLKSISCLCTECRELSEYVSARISKCPFIETKTFCSVCKIHCYKQDMREKIRNVMIFSGKRMITRHPVLAVRHLIETIKQKKGSR